MLIGLHEKDDFVKVVLKNRPIQYNSRLLLSYWEDGKTMFDGLHNLVPYIEIAML